MNELLAGLLGALLASNQPVALSNVIAEKTGIAVSLPDPNDPVEREYQKVLATDDAAQVEVDRWIRENSAFAGQGAGLSDTLLNLRIRERLKPVRKAYEDFLQRHPRHTRARLAYGSFLNDLGEEAAAAAQWERALEVEKNDPAIWNNLANHFGHNGPVEKAFDYYQKAIDLNPNEPVYLHNFATTVYLFRKHAMAHYGITEQEVFDKAMALYARALALRPTDFVLAADVAKSYYGIKPLRIADAKQAWEYTLPLARDEQDRQGVHIHLTRWAIHDQKWDAAREHLKQVTLEYYAETKRAILKNLENKQAAAKAAAKEPAPPK